MSQKAVTDALKKVGVKTTDGKTLQEVYEEAIVGKSIYAKSPFDINDPKWEMVVIGLAFSSKQD